MLLPAATLTWSLNLLCLLPSLNFGALNLWMERGNELILPASAQGTVMLQTARWRKCNKEARVFLWRRWPPALKKGFTLSTKREWCDLSPSPSLQVNSARTELYCLTFLFFPCKTAPGHFVLSQTKRSKTAAHLSLVSSIFLIFPSFCSLKSTELKFRLWIWKNVAMLLYRYKKKKKLKKLWVFFLQDFWQVQKKYIMWQFSFLRNGLCVLHRLWHRGQKRRERIGKRWQDMVFFWSLREDGFHYLRDFSRGCLLFSFFLFFLLLVSVVAPLCTPVFSATLGFL